jgi:hypothetical protein
MKGKPGLAEPRIVPSGLKVFQSPPERHIFAVQETFLRETNSPGDGDHDEKHRRNRAA